MLSSQAAKARPCSSNLPVPPRSLPLRAVQGSRPVVDARRMATRATDTEYPTAEPAREVPGDDSDVEQAEAQPARDPPRDSLMLRSAQAFLQDELPRIFETGVRSHQQQPLVLSCMEHVHRHTARCNACRTACATGMQSFCYPVPGLVLPTPGVYGCVQVTMVCCLWTKQSTKSAQTHAT